MSDFKREKHYYVIKVNDAVKYLTKRQHDDLLAILNTVWCGRMDDRREQLEAVVVEKDWPEYEPTFKMIEERVSNE